MFGAESFRGSRPFLGYTAVLSTEEAETIKGNFNPDPDRDLGPLFLEFCPLPRLIEILTVGLELCSLSPGILSLSVYLRKLMRYHIL